MGWKVSAGYGHSCCCTTDGELYTWGSNRDGCLGLPPSIKFANSPQVRKRKNERARWADAVVVVVVAAVVVVC